MEFLQFDGNVEFVNGPVSRRGNARVAA